MCRFPRCGRVLLRPMEMMANGGRLWTHFPLIFPTTISGCFLRKSPTFQTPWKHLTSGKHSPFCLACSDVPSTSQIRWHISEALRNASVVLALAPLNSAAARLPYPASVGRVLQQQSATGAARPCGRPAAAEGAGCQWHGTISPARRGCCSAKPGQATVPG